MTIWVDADSCPAGARTIILNASQRLSLPVKFVANRNIPFDFESELFEMIVLPVSENAADNYIVEHSVTGDLVVTRDIPFAERLVQKNVCALSDRGIIFTRDNIRDLLAERELSLQMHSLGVATGGKIGGFGNKEKHAFAAALDKVFYSYKISPST